EADELNAIIRAELDELPGKYKMPLVLHYFGGLSHDQISKEMKCTTAALGVRLHRARKMLGKRLSARGISLEGAALGVALAAAVPAAFVWWLLPPLSVRFVTAPLVLAIFGVAYFAIAKLAHVEEATAFLSGIGSRLARFRR
ncbi:MAG TPA: sigma-70 family RNA polymerase sigma factor, partial [Thermoanaerobaculia bacterium]|nr:sigma-70 family RNA polymerase sigma factor [Thermoanaerobaculia bacterium]